MKCLNTGSRDLVHTLEANRTQVVMWWVDGSSFATRHDMQSHTGGMMSMGKDAACGASNNQRLNTKSSTSQRQLGWHQ